MLLLDAASKLQLTLSATGSIDYTVSKVRNASPQTPVPTKGNITAVGPTDICAVPGGTDVDTVECITLNNVGVVSEDLIVTHVGGTTVRVFKVTGLAPDERVVWNETGVLLVYAADGSVKSSGTGINFVSSSGFAGPVTGYAADTYLAGSRILLPTASLIAGQTGFRWDFGVSKTGAGVAAPTVIIRYGTAGAIGDAARVTFTFAAQTAVIDRGWVRIIAAFRTVGASAVLDCEAYLNHQLATTGLNTTTTGSQELAVSSSSFDSTPVGSYIGLSVNGGASAAWTITSVMGFATI